MYFFIIIILLLLLFYIVKLKNNSIEKSNITETYKNILAILKINANIIKNKNKKKFFYKNKNKKKFFYKNKNNNHSCYF